jgi:hypothetical protein
MKLLSTKDPLTLEQCYEIIDGSELMDQDKLLLKNITDRIYAFDTKVDVLRIYIKNPESAYDFNTCCWEWNDAGLALGLGLPSDFVAVQINREEACTHYSFTEFKASYHKDTIRGILDELFEGKK